MTTKRLRFVIFQEVPGLWIVRGLEHNVGAEARTIDEGIGAAMRFVEGHTAFDIRHDHLPLSAFPPAAQKYWNAYAAGVDYPMTHLGVGTPAGWDIHAALAACPLAEIRPSRSSCEQPRQTAR